MDLANELHAEISYDLVMTDDMEFVEGTFRLPGGDWHVLVVSRCDVTEPIVVPQKWTSGARGVFIRFPRQGSLNSDAVAQVLSAALGVSKWSVVRGPDSMMLR